MKLDANPLNFLCADPALAISYVNPASRAALPRLRPALGVPAEQLLGQSIEVLHPALSAKKRWLSDPKNLPHHARIPLAEGMLELVISARYDQAGRYLGPLVCWLVSASKPRPSALEQVEALLEPLPMRVLLADQSFRIVYQNHASYLALRSLEPSLGVRAENVVGESLQIFKVDPARQKRIFSESRALSYRAQTRIGKDTLELLFSLRSYNGEPQGLLVYWQVLDRGRPIPASEEYLRFKLPELSRPENAAF